jgi:hypothetical protein
MKRTFIISYDLKDGKEEDYNNLYEAIKKYGAWAHITESTWAIVTEIDPTTIRDELKEIVPEKSSIFVVKTDHLAAWSNVKCSNKWLKNHL